ncbi:MAG: ROK family protein [Acidimicrobiales bacterium]
MPTGGGTRPSADDVPGRPVRGPVVLAVDVGGTKIEAGVVDGSGRILSDARVPTPETSDPEEVFDALGSAVVAVRTAHPESPLICGVGCGGPMTLHGETVSPLNIPAWRHFPLRQRLSDKVGLPVVVDNDAKALALGEGWLGGAQGVTDYLAMVVSTGIGAGIVLDGHLLEGRTGNAGHIGHVVVVPDGRPCRCGGQGCLEAEASGLAIEARTGHPPSEAGEEVRKATGTLVGRAVGSIANLLDLDLALVAGSVALGFGEVFFDAAQEEIARRCGLEFSRSTRIVPAGLGSTGPLIGAAALGRRRLEQMEGGATR